MSPLSPEDIGPGSDESSGWHRIQRTPSSVHRIPTPLAIVRSSVRSGVQPRAIRPGVPYAAEMPLSELTPVRRERQAVTIVKVRAPQARSIAWPIFLCGFLAGILGGMAFFKSPYGHKPGVQRVVKHARTTLHLR